MTCTTASVIVVVPWKNNTGQECKHHWLLILLREARYRFHSTKIFDEFLTLFWHFTNEPQQHKWAETV